MVSIEAPGGAAELGREGHGFELGDGVVQALHEDGQLLAEGDRAGRLAVGAGEHRHVLPRFGQGLQVFPGGLQQREQHIRGRLHHGQRDGRVVDVLGGQAEMDELGAVLEAEGGQLVLDEVLHRLHIVVGGPFNVLDRLRIGFAKGHIDVAQSVHLRLGQGRQLRQADAVQGNEVLDLDPDPVLDQTGFGEVGGQGFGVAAVTAIDRADGVEGG